MLTITWQHRVAPNLQLVKTTVSAKCNKVQHNNVKYACISCIHRYKNEGSERRNHPPRITNGPSWDQREVFLVPVFPTVVCLPAFLHWYLWWVLMNRFPNFSLWSWSPPVGALHSYGSLSSFNSFGKHVSVGRPGKFSTFPPEHRKRAPNTQNWSYHDLLLKGLFLFYHTLFTAGCLSA